MEYAAPIDVRCYAHSVEGHPQSDWEPLETHLHEVSELAGEFAAAFGAEAWGKLAGLWHDLGKYSADFQGYLRTANGLEAHLESLAGRVDHSTAGAQHASPLVNPRNLTRGGFSLGWPAYHIGSGRFA